jgi:hypothetical protein
MNDNLIIYGATARELGLSPRIYEEGEEILLTFKGRINLLRGLYAAAFHVTLPEQNKPIFLIGSICQFSVSETASFIGMVDLNCTASESQLEESIVSSA